MVIFLIIKNRNNWHVFMKYCLKSLLVVENKKAHFPVCDFAYFSCFSKNILKKVFLTILISYFN